MPVGQYRLQTGSAKKHPRSDLQIGSPMSPVVGGAPATDWSVYGNADSIAALSRTSVTVISAEVATQLLVANSPIRFLTGAHRTGHDQIAS